MFVEKTLESGECLEIGLQSKHREKKGNDNDKKKGMKFFGKDGFRLSNEVPQIINPSRLLVVLQKNNNKRT